MYVKTWDTHPDSKFFSQKFSGLRQDGSYWFPHWVKYVGWLMIFAIISVSSTILIMYGISFGLMKTYLWMSGIIVSFILGLIIFTPIKIFITILLESFCVKKKPVIRKRKINQTLLLNPDNPTVRQEVHDMRKYNKNLYHPIPLYKFTNRLEDIKYNIELRNLTTDIFAYICFMITIFYIVLIHKTPMAYYSTEVIKNLVVKGSYTNSIPFTEVKTYEKFLEYLHNTFLPALTLSYWDYTKTWGFRDDEESDNYPERRWMSESSNNYSQVDGRKTKVLEEINKRTKRQAPGTPNLYQKGWTMDPSIKLIGKPRIRQVRVKSSPCNEHPNFEIRNVECAPELNLFNVDTAHYSLEWKSYTEIEYTEMQQKPWIYQSGWQTQTLGISAKFSQYPAGGYVLDLARYIEDGRLIVQFLDAFKWVDMKTRALFIEFTTYCVNTNTFNVVTLIAERSGTGFIIPSYEIDSCQLIFLLKDVEASVLIMGGMFTLLLFFFLLREGVRIHRTSLKLYALRAFAVLDFAIIACGIVSFLFFVLQSYYVSVLLKKLEKANNNDFVSFFFVAYWNKWSDYIGATLVCLASFKIFRLLTFRVLYFQLQRTLVQAYQNFMDLVFQILVLIVAFTIFFHLILNTYAYEFSSYALSFSTMIGRTVNMDDNFDFSIFSHSSITPLFFGLFVVVVCILFVNLFIAVICFYFHEIQKVSLTNKYSVNKYVKHVITSDDKTDILHLNEINPFPKGVSRLRGGGCNVSKKIKLKRTEGETNLKTISKKKPKRVEEEEEEEEEDDEEEEDKEVYEECESEKYETIPELQTFREEDELERVRKEQKVKMKEFVVKKKYDSTKYVDLSLDRFIAMKHITAAILQEELEGKFLNRQKALAALYWSFTFGKYRKKLVEGSGSDKYFLAVTSQHETEAMKRKQLMDMKRFVEEYGLAKEWIWGESLTDLQDDFNRNFYTLNKKLRCLVKKTMIHDTRRRIKKF